MTAAGSSSSAKVASRSVAAAASAGGSPASTRARRWLVSYPRAIPIAIFLTIAAITALSVYSIESNARSGERAQMRDYAQEIASALDRRGSSFSSYLRAGAVLFSSLDEVNPRNFSQFVSEFHLDVEYRGAEGVGWISVKDANAAPEFLANIRRVQRDYPDIRPKPDGTARRIAPVTLFSPDTERNRKLLGFDMYSDPVRAAAMEEAEQTVRPTASGRIVLAQEGSKKAPGFIIFMPVFTNEGTQDESARSLAGFVYTPFNAGAFLDSAVERAGPAHLGVRLYDGAAGTDNLLVARSLHNATADRIEQPVTIANRELLLVIESADPQKFAPLSLVTLVFGLALASLLMLLARLLTKQAFEDQARLAFFEEQHSIRNSLSRELNHRVKNTLANVLSIIALTRRRTTDLAEFADSLEGRIRALSATHDLLTGTDWGTTPIHAVIEAELQHFRGVCDQAVSLGGPAVELAPNDALSFGLAIHELATNAAKYGALSVVDGSVSVMWTMVEDHLAEVEWCETGGPQVSSPRHRGFGTELIEKIVAHELRHPVKLDFLPGGVCCVMRVPVRQRGDFRIRARSDTGGER